MTEYNDEYNNIFNSITEDGIFAARDTVNAYTLTSHLGNLYDKIEKLEKRLDELDPPMNDVSGPTGLIGDPQ